MKRENWIWMPHPGHLIVARDCRYHLNTYVGGYIVSTVGEYLPDEPVREINAKSKGIVLEGRGDARLYDFIKRCGYLEIGAGRKFETMVFKGRKSAAACCLYEASDYSEIDANGYNEAGDAYKGHMVLCAKWAAK